MDLTEKVPVFKKIIEQWLDIPPAFLHFWGFCSEIKIRIAEGLFRKGQLGINEYMGAEAYLNEQVIGLERERHREARLMAALDSAERQLAAQKAKALADTQAELEDLETRLGAMGQELAKARDLSSKQSIRAPVQGTVKGLLANTVGGVVSPGQILMEIVPLEAGLEVEAFLGNQDIGYVRAGQAAEIKVATYPFTKYGVINGRVESVAGDATADEKLGLVYRLRLSMEKSSMEVGGKEEPLMPGMAVSAEIATDKRRLIEYLLTPLLRMKEESLRER